MKPWRHNDSIAQPAKMNPHVGRLQTLRHSCDRYQQYILRWCDADPQRYRDVVNHAVEQVIKIIAPQVHVLRAMVQTVQAPQPDEAMLRAVILVLAEMQHQ